jgi:uncharacterized protein YutD
MNDKAKPKRLDSRYFKTSLHTESVKDVIDKYNYDITDIEYDKGWIRGFLKGLKYTCAIRYKDYSMLMRYADKVIDEFIENF